MKQLDLHSESFVNSLYDWLNSSSTRRRIGTIVMLTNCLDDPEKSKEVIKYLFTAFGKLANEHLFQFFDKIYDAVNEVIKWEKEPGHDIKRGILETIFSALGYSGKLEERIDSFFKNLNLDNSTNINLFKQVKDGLHKAREKRNKVHPDDSPLTQEEQIDQYQSQTIALFAISCVCFELGIKVVEQEKAVEKKDKDTIQISDDKLISWFNKNIDLFTSLSESSYESYIEGKEAKLVATITRVSNNVPTLSENLFFLMQKMEDDENYEIKPGTDLGKEIPFKNLFELFLEKVNENLNKEINKQYAKNDFSWEKGMDVLKKMSENIKKKHGTILTEIEVGWKQTEKMQEDHRITGAFNTFFFRTLFLISALKNAIEDNHSGIAFYTEDRNVSIKPFEDAKYTENLKSGEMYISPAKYYDVVTAECGNNDPIKKKIEVTKGLWSVVFIHFPSNGDSTMAPSVTLCKKVKYPGLEDFKQLWEQQFLEKDGQKNKHKDDKKIKQEENEPAVDATVLKKARIDSEEVEKKKPEDDIKIEKEEQQPQESDSRVKENEQKFFDYVQGQKKQLLETYKKEILLANKEAKELDELKYNERMTLEGNYNVVDSQITIVKAKIDAELKKQEDSKKALEREAQRKELEKKFEKEKEETLSGLKNLYVNTNVIRDCKEQAIKNIQELCYDHTISSEENKNKIVEIDKNCRAEIVRLEEDRLINKLNKWLNKNWKWCLGMIAFVVLFFVLMNIGNSDGRMTVPEGKAVPSLESNKWTVPLMDGNSVNELATISSIDGSDSHYNIHIIDGNGKEINATIRVDWQNGIVMSPELGEGKVVENNKMKSINLIFEKWKFTKNY